MKKLLLGLLAFLAIPTVIYLAAVFYLLYQGEDFCQAFITPLGVLFLLVMEMFGYPIRM